MRRRIANALRFLAIDAVKAAGSGHPGARLFEFFGITADAVAGAARPLVRPLGAMAPCSAS